ncbi:unnamed protein product [Schistosoma margrebowiei]|uniref:Uncharacterized protein n=1 Tax=Schistosoma margrebowiei TaxID=48269 RepID=A0A183N7J4_9TREM|nr:unnamed protein product [Schistosoma margrebowiei]
MLLYSDNIEKNAPHTHAVPLALSKDPHNAPIGWEYHGSWNIKSSSETKKKVITMNVIQFSSPKNYSRDDDKDQFYDRLQSTMEKFPSKRT